MSINATKWTFLIFFKAPSLWPSFIPYPLSPLHLESTFLGVKDLLFIVFDFPRQASLRDQVSRIVWTIRNSRFPNIHICLCVHSPHWCVHPRFAEQNNIWSLYFFLAEFSLEISRTPQVLGLLEEFCPTDTPCHQTRKHALNFHLRNKKIKWRAFFQTFSLERIRVPSCKTTQIYACLLQYQYKWILLQKLRLLFFSWNNSFPYACSGIRSFAWNSSFSIHLFLFLSPPRDCLYHLEEFRSTTQILWNPVHDSDRCLFLSTSQ